MRIPLPAAVSELFCADDCCSDKASELALLATRGAQRRVLIAVLLINLVMFMIEAWAGIVARSVALVADSVDMFGDATVYGLSLYALGRGVRWRAGAALAKGGIVLAFGAWILFEAVRRLLAGGAPDAGLIGGIGLLALTANLTCLALLWRFRSQDVNMSSTFECSRNDVIANGGVLVAAGGVWLTGAAWPDVLVGLLVAAVFLRSAWSILRTAWPEYRTGEATAHRHEQPTVAPLEFFGPSR